MGLAGAPCLVFGWRDPFEKVSAIRFAWRSRDEIDFARRHRDLRTSAFVAGACPAAAHGTAEWIVRRLSLGVACGLDKLIARPMQFFEVLERRRSVRAFASKQVEREKLSALLEAVRLAPSAGDCQAYEIVVVREPSRKTALADAAFGQEFLAQAPVVLAFVADPQHNTAKYGERGASLYCVQDATIAAAYAQLAASALGLASCWVGAFDERRVAAALKASGNLRPVALMPMGYAAETPTRPPRRSIGEIARSETFDGATKG